MLNRILTRLLTLITTRLELRVHQGPTPGEKYRVTFHLRDNNQ